MGEDLKAHRLGQWWGVLRRGLLVASLSALPSGCATVPPEAARLSRTVGEDLTAVQASYRSLVHRHFSGLREQVNDYIDLRWRPVYLREFITRGELAKLAGASDPVEVLEGVEDWVGIAMEEIEAKRRTMLDPISRQEDSLLTNVDEAFARLLRANAAVTAHLVSLRKVQAAQDQTLEDLRLRGLRDRINTGLVAASDSTAVYLERLENERKKLEAASPRSHRSRH
jgi:hypothetical protein